MKPRLIQNSRFRIQSFLWLSLIVLVPAISSAQDLDIPQKEVSPRGAFLRSLVIPGWGHHYVDKTDWKRGQYHMGAEAVMLLSYVGIKMRNNHLENNLITYAQSNAGIDLNSKPREVYLAVSQFDNLEEYNDYLLRARRWNELIEDTPENQWNWNASEARFDYGDMRDRIDKNENQLPAILTLMVANRVVSGISAFVKARNYNSHLPEASFSYLNEFGEPGFTATLSYSF